MTKDKLTPEEEKEFDSLAELTFPELICSGERVLAYSLDGEDAKDIAAQLAQKREERLLKELKEKVEKLIDDNDDGMWSGRETADHILSHLQSLEDKETKQ